MGYLQLLGVLIHKDGHLVVFYLWKAFQTIDVVLCRKPCSGYKMKEMTGSGIFAGSEENDESESGSANPTPGSKTGLRMYQVSFNSLHVRFH